MAAEIGMSDRALRDQAVQYGIAPRPVGTAGHELGRYRGPQKFPQLVWAAFTGQGATRRVQHFLAAVGHRNLSDAARHLQIHQSVLSNQLDILERSAQQELFERAANGYRTMTLTPAGATLARGARAALRKMSAPQAPGPSRDC
ncbi:LysR family transcriptional regulator [Streptomyces bauhiniae]|uniref:LysR family transcriptional regulator n=1 Tax=Streptomyces bauhiniae TaxID=2340725 RepID=UPI0033253FE4